MSRVVVAVAGDSISAGSPLWDPDPGVRARIPAPDERSQWQWWAAQAEARLEFRTTAVYGERTDQIARRLDTVLESADVLIVQGGINDVVQRRPVEEAARNIGEMLERGRAAGLALAVPDVLPWNNGDERAAADIQRLNALIRELAARAGAALLPFHETLADPGDPTRMRTGLTDDGDHPSVEGHRLLGERAFRLDVEL
ncbi:MAG TPA: SGNH/GDSL hydrolase family protein [Gaiellaceae bacterium]|jgi:lysophospholipase L1-like esterase|nr:SGNH/GDSL hydrolase family protein [Gaiellaceae bacterium]